MSTTEPMVRTDAREALESLHIPRSREPTVTGLTLLGVGLCLLGAAFAAGFIVGLGMRVADSLPFVRGP